MAMQGEVRFPGVGQVRRGEMRWQSGVKPAVAVVEMVPQAGMPQGEGELVWSCGNTRLVFPDCRVKRMTLRRGLQGLVWRMEIVDRRWRWKFAKVSGRYNVRDSAGKLLRWTEKTPRELAALCFAAMGERSWDVESLPNELRPEVDWVQAGAAKELERLCAALGCKVGLGLDNRAKVYRAGMGFGVTLTTSHPAMLAALERSGQWTIQHRYRQGGSVQQGLRAAKRPTAPFGQRPIKTAVFVAKTDQKNGLAEPNG